MDTMLKEDILNCSYNFYPSVQVDTFFKMKKNLKKFAGMKIKSRKIEINLKKSNSCARTLRR